MEERNITLKRALEVARTWEAAGEQASRMSLASPSINAIRSSSRRADHTREQRTAKDDRECFNCGRRGHISKDLTCPARGKKCSKCQKLGHFVVKCRSTGGKFSASVRPKRRAGGRAYHIGESEVAAESSDNFEDDFAFGVLNGESRAAPRVKLTVNGICTEVLVDCGATCNLLGRTCWNA